MLGETTVSPKSACPILTCHQMTHSISPSHCVNVLCKAWFLVTLSSGSMENSKGPLLLWVGGLIKYAVMGFKISRGAADHVNVVCDVYVYIMCKFSMLWHIVQRHEDQGDILYTHLQDC